MNLGTKFSILARGLLVGAGLFLQSCTGPTFNLKPTAAGGEEAPCGLGTSYKGVITLGADETGEAESTTAGGTNLVDHGKCGGGDGIDAIYKLVVTEPIFISIDFCSDFDEIIYSLWRGCPSEGDQFNCGGNEASCTRNDACLEPGTYYIAVEGYEYVPDEGFQPTVGPFSISYETGSCR